MKIPDFTGCPDGYRTYEGSDNKRSIDYNGEKYLLKLPERIEARKNDLQTSNVNNVLSEYIGSHVVASIGLETHETILGSYQGRPAVACKDFTGNGYHLQEFSWLMRTMYDKSEVKRFPTYNQLYDVIDHHPMLDGIRKEAIERYWNTIIADAIIGNFDRHKGNWGYLVNEELKDIKLAPIYDCGSSLYPSLAEDKMKGILSSPDEIEKRIYEFPKIALNKNSNPGKEDKFGYYELISSGMDKNCTKALFSIYPHIDMGRIYQIVENAPFLSDQRIEFYEKMMSYRKELILDRSREMLIEQVKGETTQYQNGDMTVFRIPYNDLSLADSKELSLALCEDGAAAFYGDRSVCYRLEGEYGGETVYENNTWIWKGNVSDKEELENFAAYMIKDLELER